MKMYECTDEAVTHRGTDLSRLPWEIMKRGSPAARRRLFVDITHPSTIPRSTGFGFQIAYYLDASTRSRHFGITLSDCNYSNYHNNFFNRSLSFNYYINTTSAYQTHDYNNIAYEGS